MYINFTHCFPYRNHARASAAACRMVGLDPHLILRTRRADTIHNSKNEDIGWVGNVLFDRIVGSTIYTCTPGEVRYKNLCIMQSLVTSYAFMYLTIYTYNIHTLISYR